MAYTTISDSSAHFQTEIYTGTGSSQSITNTGNSNLRPDWLWIKKRGGGSDRAHQLYDSVRGTTKLIHSNTDGAESTTSTGLSTFNTDGFTVVSDDGANGNGNTYVGWQWAGAGTAPTQTYRVVVVSDGGNKYRWRNSGNTATFAQSAVTLDLQEGGTYTIDGSDSTMDSHPIKLSTTSNGTHGGGSSYNTGVVYKLDGSTVTESAYVSGYASATTRQLVITVAASAPTLYYYCHYHSGMGGQINTNSTFGSTNFDGSILSIVNANTTAGFSIATYTGNGSAATIGHGLNTAPDVVIVKSRNNAVDWQVYIDAFGNDDDGLFLNTNAQKFTSSNYWNNGTTSSVFGVSSNTGVGANTYTYVAYSFSAIKGYSSFGTYQGTGNAEGPFIYTGFKPAWFLVKGYDITQNWQLWDSKRNASTPAPAIGNPRQRTLSPSVNDAESGDYDVDFCSTGVKIRNSDGAWNGDGNNYTYWAFAECPLVAGGVVSTGG